MIRAWSRPENFDGDPASAPMLFARVRPDLACDTLNTTDNGRYRNGPKELPSRASESRRQTVHRRRRHDFFLVRESVTDLHDADRASL